MQYYSVCVVMICGSRDGFFPREREKRPNARKDKVTVIQVRSDASPLHILSSLSPSIYSMNSLPCRSKTDVLLLLISLFLVVNAAFASVFRKSEKRKNVWIY